MLLPLQTPTSKHIDTKPFIKDNIDSCVCKCMYTCICNLKKVSNKLMRTSPSYYINVFSSRVQACCIVCTCSYRLFVYLRAI